MSVISLEHVSFGYGGKGDSSKKGGIIHDISLEIPAGETFVLLGHNGAGKTTLIRLLLGFLPKFEGVARLFDRDVADPEARRNVGFLPEQPVSSPHFTSRRFLEFFGRLTGMTGEPLAKRIEELLDRTGIAAHGDKPLPEYSKGMLQRLNLCRALLHDPGLIILDEPIIGLDPLGQSLVKEIVIEEGRRGKTILVNTHSTSFARAIADRIGLLMGGRLVDTFRPDRLLAAAFPLQAMVEGIPETQRQRFVTAFSGTQVSEGRLRLLLDNDDQVRSLLELCHTGTSRLLSLEPLIDPLEGAFLRHAAGLDDREKAR